VVNQESLSNQLNEQATFVLKETKYFVCDFFSHTQIDCPPIIFLGFGNAKCHTVYIVKTKTFHLSLSIFPLFLRQKNSDKEPFSFKLFDRFKQRKKRSFYQFFGQI